MENLEKQVIKRVIINALISVAFTVVCLFAIIWFAEWTYNIKEWHSISRGVFGILTGVSVFWSITHGAGIVNTHRMQMNQYRAQQKAENKDKSV